MTPKLQERTSLFVGGRAAAEDWINVSANVVPICSPAHDSLRFSVCGTVPTAPRLAPRVRAQYNRSKNNE
jgi:hypothetical protein